VEHEAAACLDRAAHQHLHPVDVLRQADTVGLGNDLELHQEIGHAEIGRRLVDHDPHRAFGRMGADIDHRAREALVAHPRHGEKELPVEIARAGFRLHRAGDRHQRMLRRRDGLSIPGPFPASRDRGSPAARRRT
jgi:hypothetical protein